MNIRRVMTYTAIATLTAAGGVGAFLAADYFIINPYMTAANKAAAEQAVAEQAATSRRAEWAAAVQASVESWKRGDIHDPTPQPVPEPEPTAADMGVGVGVAWTKLLDMGEMPAVATESEIEQTVTGQWKIYGRPAGEGSIVERIIEGTHEHRIDAASERTKHAIARLMHSVPVMPISGPDRLTNIYDLKETTDIKLSINADTARAAERAADAAERAADAAERMPFVMSELERLQAEQEKPLFKSRLMEPVITDEVKQALTHGIFTLPRQEQDRLQELADEVTSSTAMFEDRRTAARWADRAEAEANFLSAMIGTFEIQMEQGAAFIELVNRPP